MSNEVILQDIIPYIKEDTKFWFVRSMKGYFYDEFVKNEFIGLGWNIINSTNIHNGEEKLKELLKSHYPTQTKPGLALNKCFRFYMEMKVGDIVLLPSSRSQFITFAVIGDYYEEKHLDKDIEDESVSKIKIGSDSIGTIKCPYRKRRSITVLKTVEGSKLDSRLLNALSSYHGVSSVDEYAEIILRAIFSVFYFKDKFSFQLEVNRKESISPKNLGRFLYNVFEYLDTNYEEDSISSKMTLNSPGIIGFDLQAVYDLAKGAPLLFILAYIGINGFKFKDLEVNSFIDTVYKLIDRKKVVRRRDLELKSIELDNDGKELDNTFKRIEIAKALNINPEQLKILDKIEKDAGYLDIGIDTNVIQISEFYNRSSKSDQQE